MQSIALVGRTNVGKSTLFNRLTRTRNALVANFPGLTRDRQYGIAQVGAHSYILIDTGGIAAKGAGLDAQVIRQAQMAVEEADLLFFLVDGRAGCTPEDELLAVRLRASGKPLVLVVNKADGVAQDVLKGEFYRLGLGSVHLISAAHGRGVSALMHSVLDSDGQPAQSDTEAGPPAGVKVAVIGRPNVGKSTLINRLLGEDRMLVFDQPGTTRDAIYLPLVRGKDHYVLIDTAGVRRRGRVKETVEKFSVVKTLSAIQDCNVALLLIDSDEDLVEQDLHLLSQVIEAGKGIVLACNKWDGLSSDGRQRLRTSLDRRLRFISYLKVHFISALYGSGVDKLLAAVDRAWQSASVSLRTRDLNLMLQEALAEHAPPLVRGRRVKLRYAHPGGTNPPRVVIHGNQTRELPDQYRRYLENRFSNLLKLEGTPLVVELRTGENPFAGRRNRLTERQLLRRRRLVQHTRKTRRRKQGR